MEKVNGESLNIIDSNIEKITEIFPETIVDGKFNKETLLNLIGISQEKLDEKYSFTWNGKYNSFKLSQVTSTGTLLPCKEKSVDWNNTNNIYIEGDNLEVLKILQKSYNRKIKCIYIDPPYNREADEIYEDNFKDNLKEYLKKSGQNMKANPETTGKKHTNWLNMMYPRLLLSKNLLSADGTIFISIDDIEHSNLKKICDEIFGEINFVTSIPRICSFQRSGQEAYMNVSHDYILCYSYNKDFKNVIKKEYDINKVKKDNIGIYVPGDTKAILAAPTQGYSEGGDYDFEYNGKIYSPVDSNGVRNRWLWTKERMQAAADLGILVETGKTLRMQIYLDKKFEQGSNMMVDKEENMKFHTADFMKDKYDNPNGTKELKNLFNGKDIFGNPKPVCLIKKLIELCTEKNDIIMDFFSGSATTAQAVYELNEVNNNYKYILVQLPENLDIALENASGNNKTLIQNAISVCDEINESHTICAIGEERIRRVINSLKNKEGLDLGFKVFKLDSSNIKVWNGEDLDADKANQYFLEHIDPIVEGRTDDDLLYEILLKEGMMLSSPVEEKIINDKKIYSVGLGYMIVCLDNNIDVELVREIGKLKPETVIFKDSGFSDENAKANALQELKKLGIDEEKVKSI